jgi:hypothetical protein
MPTKGGDLATAKSVSESESAEWILRDSIRRATEFIQVIRVQILKLPRLDSSQYGLIADYL